MVTVKAAAHGAKFHIACLAQRYDPFERERHECCAQAGRSSKESRPRIRRMQQAATGGSVAHVHALCRRTCPGYATQAPQRARLTRLWRRLKRC